MSDESRAALLAAVNRLVVDDAAPRLYEALTDAVPPARRLSMRFVGDYDDLNPLLDLACTHPDHYDNVMALVESKRESRGAPPLDPKRGQVEKFNKNDYMADFMAKKRARERKAAEVENLMRPERDRLVGRARLDFMQMQAAKWKAELDKRLAAARAAQEGRIRLPELDAIRATFWDQVDRELDELEEYARREMLKPPHARSPRPR